MFWFLNLGRCQFLRLLLSSDSSRSPTQESGSYSTPTPYFNLQWLLKMFLLFFSLTSGFVFILISYALKFF